jgi:hypothetical protein
MAEGYTRENGILRHRDYFDRSLEIGAGGIYTTLDDLVLWNHALNAPGFLKSDSLHEMFSVHPRGNYGYGGSLGTSRYVEFSMRAEIQALPLLRFDAPIKRRSFLCLQMRMIPPCAIYLLQSQTTSVWTVDS